MTRKWAIFDNDEMRFYGKYFDTFEEAKALVDKWMTDAQPCASYTIYERHYHVRAK